MVGGPYQTKAHRGDKNHEFPHNHIMGFMLLPYQMKMCSYAHERPLQTVCLVKWKEGEMALRQQFVASPIKTPAHMLRDVCFCFSMI